MFHVKHLTSATVSVVPQGGFHVEHQHGVCPASDKLLQEMRRMRWTRELSTLSSVACVDHMRWVLDTNAIDQPDGDN